MRHPDSAERNVLAPDCRRCPALVESRDCISWGNGPPGGDHGDAAVMVVGEAPGAGDPDADEWQGGNRSGFAYTSRHSGRRVRELLSAVGYADRAYFTNAVKCFPAGEDGSNREPTAAERTNCRVHLEAELEGVEPAVVVATGKHATASLLAFEDRELDGFVERVLDPIDLPTLGVTLLPILHPSYQDVWIARLGYEEAEYRGEIRATLDRIVGG